jgi:hypothetical protein
MSSNYRKGTEIEHADNRRIAMLSYIILAGLIDEP